MIAPEAENNRSTLPEEDGIHRTCLASCCKVGYALSFVAQYISGDRLSFTGEVKYWASSDMSDCINMYYKKYSFSPATIKNIPSVLLLIGQEND